MTGIITCLASLDCRKPRGNLVAFGNASGRYALADAAIAHRDLEPRRTCGSVVLTL